MLNIMKMKLFPTFSRIISIPTNDKKSYNIIFISENSNFIEAYPKLNIRRQFAKYITQIQYKNPKVLVTMKSLLPYKSELGLIPIINTSIPVNIFMDTSAFFNALDSRLGKQSYKRPIVFQKVVDYINKCKASNESNSILLYHIDMSKPVEDQFLYRRSVILALMAQIGDGEMPFDNVILAIDNVDGMKFFSIYNRNQKPLGFQKILSIIKRLVPKEKDIDTKVDDNIDDVKSESMKILTDRPD